MDRFICDGCLAAAYRDRTLFCNRSACGSVAPRYIQTKKAKVGVFTALSTRSTERATSLAETEAAEFDEYDELLASLGRTEDQDQRIAVHEAGHAVGARLLGHPLGGATVNPDRGHEGLCWGVGHKEALSEGRGDASEGSRGACPADASCGRGPQRRLQCLRERVCPLHRADGKVGQPNACCSTMSLLCLLTTFGRLANLLC
jgi:hypothetical protein